MRRIKITPMATSLLEAMAYKNSASAEALHVQTLDPGNSV